ncbi:hypothetical protein L207DRAFT_223377 [Hyaloscypha variabilis F]|uniref:Uncharacterized protein n=1 Tax=Hyaloscypha variabilis (strain UAMH 11265 / GT02V1 / F) TaxID=1149755 RepID=A0A2J6QWB7_HYAVF|nr:hypothetical protein L207DRAFT_223377 [Hyaloscypha variabilis F]
MLSDEPHSRHKPLYLPKRTYKVPSGTGSAFSLDSRHHMLVAGKVLARARTPVLKSQHLSQQHPANALSPLPLKHFPSVPNFTLFSHQCSFFTSKITHSFCQQRMPSSSLDISFVPSYPTSIPACFSRSAGRIPNDPAQRPR